MKKKILLMVIVVLFSACGQNHTKKDSKKGLSEAGNVKVRYNIDLTKSYSERRFCLQDIADVEYVALETKENVLVDDAFEMGVFDSCIVVCNSMKGDFLFFDMKGKFRSRFNRMGGSGEEYLMISTWLYDDDNQELYVLDNLSQKRMLVYSATGQFKREMRFPRDRWFNNYLYNFDDSSLLALKTDITDYNKYIDSKDIDLNDYVLLSKKNGEIVFPVKTVRKTVPTSFIMRLNGESINVKIPMGTIIKDGEDFLISDVSSDTIFLLKKDRRLMPFLVRTPTVSNTKRPILLEVSLKTDKYVFLKKTVYDLESKDMNGFSKSGTILGIDLDKNEIFEPYFYNKDFPNCKSFNKIQSFSPKDAGKHMGARPINAYILVDALEKGELSGQLKQIASTLHEDDNLVLMILRLKLLAASREESPIPKRNPVFCSLTPPQAAGNALAEFK